MVEESISGARPTAARDAAGEVAAWEETIRAHSRMLYRIAYAVLRHHHDAEDAVQETLQRAWRYRARLEQVDSPQAWLARIAWRVARRRRPRTAMVSLEDLSELRQLRASGMAADELASRRQMQELMEVLIRHLPAKLRQPLLLSTVQELSSPEIAFILGIPEASVRSRCLRARRLLREKLGHSLATEKEKKARHA